MEETKTKDEENSQEEKATTADAGWSNKGFFSKPDNSTLGKNSKFPLGRVK